MKYEQESRNFYINCISLNRLTCNSVCETHMIKYK